MVGCRFNAKNTLDKNYLYLAQQHGAEVFAETEVIKVIPQHDSTYILETRQSTSWFNRNPKLFRARNVIFSGGVLGSVKLLLEQKYIHKTLPKLSEQLGKVIRTNGESLVGATSLSSDQDFTDGIAISSAFKPDEKTKIELVRYSKGSDAMKLLSVPLVGPGSILVRPLKMIIEIIKSFSGAIRLWLKKDWAARTMILLVMQTVDNQIAFGIKRRWYKFFRHSFGSAPTGLPPTSLRRSSRRTSAPARPI
jgi:cholesterol oxidase